MSSRRPLITKLVYLVLIAILLIPLSILSRPATQTASGEMTPGGELAQLRTEYNLSQTKLGDIDPTSETIRLASLGMRGIAANILWYKANHYKKVEDWANLSAAVEQITKLQPNFFKIWDFQAHNLAYNVSVEFDDYRDRYKWVIKGIEFFQEGQRYNQNDPRFEHRIGWTIGQKIGRADERKQFRRLFREDDDFHKDRRPQDRDNWLVGYEWFKRAEEKVKDPSLIKGTSPVLFYSEAAKSLINYAESLETDGRFGDVTKTAWQKASDEFLAFGNRVLPTTFGYDIQLNEQENEVKRGENLAKELDSLAPGVREQIRNEKLAKLSDKEREALDTPLEKRTTAQFELAYGAETKTKVTHREVADRAPEEHLVKARELAAEAAHAQEVADSTQRYRSIVNYEYWRARSKAGFDDDWQQAQENVFNAREHLRATRFAEARAAYETAFKHWRAILDRYPELRTESVTIQELVEEIGRYQRALSQDNLPFPKDFVLQDILDQQNSGEKFDAAAAKAAESEGDEEASADPAEPAQATPSGESTVSPAAEASAAPQSAPAENTPAAETAPEPSPAADAGDASDAGDAPATPDEEPAADQPSTAPGADGTGAEPAATEAPATP